MGRNGHQKQVKEYLRVSERAQFNGIKEAANDITVVRQHNAQQKENALIANEIKTNKFIKA